MAIEMKRTASMASAAMERGLTLRMMLLESRRARAPHSRKMISQEFT